MSHLAVTLLREIHVFRGEIQTKVYQAEDCCFPEKKSTLGNNIYADIYLRHTIAVQWVVVWWFQATI